MLVVFLSCKDDAAYIGFPKDPRLNTFYAEIPLGASVLYSDSVATQNLPPTDASDPVKRILVGECMDAVFGHMVAKAYANIAPPAVAVSTPGTATLDSLVLQLKVDFYNYGSKVASTQTLQVYEVLDPINYSDTYFGNTPIAIGTQSLANHSFLVDPVEYDDAFLKNSDSDTTDDKHLQIRLRVSNVLGENLLNELKLKTAEDGANILDDFTMFSEKYKGLAFVMSQADKILGMDLSFNPTAVPRSRDSKLSLYFTDGGVQTRADFVLSYNYDFSTLRGNSAKSFSTIETERSLTGLSGIEAFKDFKTQDGKTYVQSGTALFAKFDLTEFYNYTDTMANLIFQSAQLKLVNTTTEKHPTGIILRILDDTNHYLNPYIDAEVDNPLTGSQDTIKVIDPRWGKMRSGVNMGTAASPTMDVRTDIFDVIELDENHEIRPILMTEFLQLAYRYRHDTLKVKQFAIIPVPSELGKTVNGMVIEANPVLQVYYSKPVTKVQ